MQWNTVNHIVQAFKSKCYSKLLLFSQFEVNFDVLVYSEFRIICVKLTQYYIFGHVAINSTSFVAKLFRSIDIRGLSQCNIFIKYTIQVI